MRIIGFRVVSQIDDCQQLALAFELINQELEEYIMLAVVEDPRVNLIGVVAVDDLKC